MSNYNFSIKGQDLLYKKLQHNMQKTAVKQIVKTHTIDMHNKVIENMNSVYTGHYEGNKFVSPTGNTRRQTKVEFDNGGLTGKSVTDTPYIGYLEDGTRFMAARPAIGPAWRKERPLFLSELWDLVR